MKYKNIREEELKNRVAKDFLVRLIQQKLLEMWIFVFLPKM